MDNIYQSFKNDFIKLCISNATKDMIIYDFGFNAITYSYENILNSCYKLISVFKKNGLKEGDCIVSILPNSPEAIICFFAALLYGIDYAPLPCTATNREYNNWKKLVKPKLIIKKQGIANYEETTKTIECACNGDFFWLNEKKREITNNRVSNILLMTSGTTGLPKAMSINSDSLWSSGHAFLNCYNINNSGLRFWNYLPMSYLGGLYNLALIPLICNGSFVISEPFSGKTILNYWNFVKKHSINALWFVPSIIQGLLKIEHLLGKNIYKDYADKIKIAFLGTAPIALKQKLQFEEIFGIKLFENFALSETTFLTGELENNIKYRKEKSVGSVLPYVSIKIKKIDNNIQSGSLWVKTPYLFNGYLSENGKIELEKDEEGYFNTKDIGYINSDNLLVLEGRNRDIIKKGGLFVSLTEIESVMLNYKEIENVAAIPIKHDFYGEAYYLCVILSKNCNEKDCIEKIHLWMIDNFVSYKLPEKIIALKEFPRTASGKIQKNKILSMLSDKKNEK